MSFPSPPNHEMFAANGCYGRSALLVDAGYLLAAAALMTLGTASRRGLAVDYEGLVNALVAFIDEHSSGLPRLRTYWYDAAPSGNPTYEHDRISSLPYVQVSLGRLARDGSQKGVDVLIYHDLLTLARQRAIARAYLIAGDEDLWLSVREAKQLGIQVVLLGVLAPDNHNQSRRLVREADEFILLPRRILEPYLSTRPHERELPTGELMPLRRVAAQAAEDWLQNASRGEALDLLARFPRLPQELDIALVHTAEESVGSLRGRGDLKAELRGNFWFSLKRELAAADALAHEGPDVVDF